MKNRPWLLIVLAFAVLLAAWGFFFYIANKHKPEMIPVPEREAQQSEALKDGRR